MTMLPLRLCHAFMNKFHHLSVTLDFELSTVVFPVIFLLVVLPFDILYDSIPSNFIFLKPL